MVTRGELKQYVRTAFIESAKNSRAETGADALSGITEFKYDNGFVCKPDNFDCWSYVKFFSNEIQSLFSTVLNWIGCSDVTSTSSHFPALSPATTTCQCSLQTTVDIMGTQYNATPQDFIFLNASNCSALDQNFNHTNVSSLCTQLNGTSIDVAGHNANHTADDNHTICKF